jgi:hypothetical protein
VEASNMAFKIGLRVPIEKTEDTAEEKQNNGKLKIMLKTTRENKEA